MTDKVKVKLTHTFETLSFNPAGASGALTPELVAAPGATDEEKAEIEAKNAGIKAGNDAIIAESDKRDYLHANNFRSSFTDLAVSTTAGGILGSGDISTSLNLKIMGDDSYYTTKGGYANTASMIEANLSMPYSISPKVDVSVDSQWRHVLSESGPNANRFLVIPSITYTFNDMFSVYQAGGVILSARDNSAFRRNYTRMYIETGFTVTPLKGLNVGMDVNQD